MGPSTPKAKSDAQIKTEAQLEEERVRFEGEKRQFIERAGAYEALTRDRLSGERSSFEQADFIPMNNAGIYIPQKFDPTFDPTKFAGQDLSWFQASNLGLNPIQPLSIPSSTLGGSSTTDKYWSRQSRKSTPRGNV